MQELGDCGNLEEEFDVSGSCEGSAGDAGCGIGAARAQPAAVPRAKAGDGGR